MMFYIGDALRLDNDHVQMGNMQVQTFDENGDDDITVDLPTSIFDMNTRVLTGQTDTHIKRADFEITGDNVEFNVETKKGKLSGHVHMTIYDLNATANAGADEESGSKSQNRPRPKPHEQSLPCFRPGFERGRIFSNGSRALHSRSSEAGNTAGARPRRVAMRRQMCARRRKPPRPRSQASRRRRGQPGKRTPTDKPAEPRTTEIFAKECELDNPSHIGIFTGDVIVVNPQFKMNCDKLFAYIRHDEPKDAPDKASEKTPASRARKKHPSPARRALRLRLPGHLAIRSRRIPSKETKRRRRLRSPRRPRPFPLPQDPTVKRARTGAVSGGVAKAAAARGHKAASDALKGAAESEPRRTRLRTKSRADCRRPLPKETSSSRRTKRIANGNVEHDVAHAKKALYDTDTGDVTLYGKPDVQQGGNHVIALDETTIIILNRSGHMTVHGPHKVVLENSGSTASDSKNTNAR